MALSWNHVLRVKNEGVGNQMKMESELKLRKKFNIGEYTALGIQPRLPRVYLIDHNLILRSRNHPAAGTPMMLCSAEMLIILP